MEELVVLVNDKNEEIGTMPKSIVHTAHTPLHRAFSSYVFNGKGEFLLTQRARSKKTWPGIWTNSCCGHPSPGENTEEAIKRRLMNELGLIPLKIEIILPNFRYRVEKDGVVENEICPVYLVRVASEPKLNLTEVETYLWLKWEDYLEKMHRHPENYSEWSILQSAELRDKPLLVQFTQTL